MIITNIWRRQPGKYFFLCTKDESGKWREHCFPKSKINTVRPFIKKHVEDDVYFCPHGFSKNRRLRQYAVAPSLFWSDLDEVNPRKLKSKPTIAFESSPGRHVGLWYVDDGYIDDKANKKFNYNIKADISGWDYTQVLRVPGTYNYKPHYEKNEKFPRVKILWSDGPSYKKNQLVSEHRSSTGDVDEILEKYGKAIPWKIRKEITKGEPEHGKRSEVLWKIGNELVEAGVEYEDTVSLLIGCPWNKFSERKDGGERQIRQELDKYYEEPSSEKKKKVEKKKKKKYDREEESPLEFTDLDSIAPSMATIQREELEWVYYPYLARGELTILEGDPGLGKSYLAQYMAGCIASGRELPVIDKAFKMARGPVLMFDVENTASTITKARFEWNGFKGHKLKDLRQVEVPFFIDSDEGWEFINKIVDAVKPAMIVFDTVGHYTGQADTHKSSEVLQIMGRFRTIAKQYHCAVLILRHLTKSSKTPAIYRGQGSIAFSGLARSVMTMGVMPEDPKLRAVCQSKFNLGPQGKALTFEIMKAPSVTDPLRSVLEFGDIVNITADQILSSPATPQDDGHSKNDIEDFLRDVLSNGPAPSKDIKRDAELRSITTRDLNRVAREIGVTRVKGGKWAL